MNTQKSYCCKISGRVQGVFYRKSIQANALKQNFSGYVQNLPDKTVKACVSCEESRLEQFLEILRKGSTLSRVEDITIEPCDEVFTGEFEVVK